MLPNKTPSGQRVLEEGLFIGETLILPIKTLKSREVRKEDLAIEGLETEEGPRPQRCRLNRNRGWVGGLTDWW